MRWFRKSDPGSQTATPESEPRFECRSGLLTPAEQAFLDVLEENLAPDYRVFAKVAAAGIVDIQTQVPDPRRHVLLQEITSQVFDFVICELPEFKILGVVLLEDMPENAAGRQVSDAFVDRLMAAVGIPLVHIPARENYTATEVKIEIARSLFVKWRDTPAEDGTPAAARIAPQPGRRSRANTAGQRGYGTCPICGAAVVKRKAKSGKFAGKIFLACANYPECKNLRLLKNPAAAPRVSNRE